MPFVELFHLLILVSSFIKGVKNNACLIALAWRIQWINTCEALYTVPGSKDSVKLIHVYCHDYFWEIKDSVRRKAIKVDVQGSARTTEWRVGPFTETGRQEDEGACDQMLSLFLYLLGKTFKNSCPGDSGDKFLELRGQREFGVRNFHNLSVS